MYEIWLVLNILWELARDVWPLLVGAAVLWVVLMVAAARRRGAAWGRGLPSAVAVGGVVAVAAFLLVPGLTKSSLGEMRYWVDWANLVGIALAVGAVGVAFAWPLMTMKQAGSRG
ncbi:MAG: hypothetical protein MUC74_10865 [Ideonella sp.]|jgi:hypothetical protein|nr:hypothetical protein [Ideonella sp.]